MDTPKTVYLFFGDDDFAMAEAIQQMVKKLGDASLASLNLKHYDATNLEANDLETTALALPFLGPRRLLIVDHAERLEQSPNVLQRVLQLLDRLPGSTAVVLLDCFEFPRYRRAEAEDRHIRASPLHQWAHAHPDAAYSRRFEKPVGPEFVNWLIKRCQAIGGDIDPSAAALIAELVAEDVRSAHHELRKLLDFVDGKRPIRSTDVEALTPFHGQTDVFAMVDAMGQRDGRRALVHLRRLLEQDDPFYVLSMVIRQFRLIIQAREALDSAKSPHQLMRDRPYVIDKAAGQARKFHLPELEQIYHDLFAMDLAAKTGSVDLSTALDTFIARLGSQ